MANEHIKDLKVSINELVAIFMRGAEYGFRADNPTRDEIEEEIATIIRSD